MLHPENAFKVATYSQFQWFRCGVHAERARANLNNARYAKERNDVYLTSYWVKEARREWLTYRKMLRELA